MAMASVLQTLMDQEAVIERDTAVPDEAGGKTGRDWQPLATVECVLWWWKGSKSSDKSPSAQYARPQATIDITGGDMMLPLGTDVTDRDRIGTVTNEEGEVLEEGPFRIIAVNRYSDHIELSLESP